jgi:hypothetical protein
MSGEDQRIREARDRFEKRLRDQGVSSSDARREAVKQAQKADRRKER